MSEATLQLYAMLKRRLAGQAQKWFVERVAEIGDRASSAWEGRFAALLSMASRFAPRADLEPDAEELAGCHAALAGWNPERWTMLEAMRVALLLARPDIEEGPSFARDLEDAFLYADLGESCAFYRALALLPDGARFSWRGGEGCRSNIGAVFEAAACDTPYPARFFDDIAWRQLAIKAVFIDAPLWRVYGLDDRLSPELARMALDLADERRRAGRDVQHQLWLCLGEHGGERGLASLEQEAACENPRGRQAAALGFARAGQHERVRAMLKAERDAQVAQTLRQALAGQSDQRSFRALDTRSS